MSKRAYGEGSVYQRKDGRWVATIMLDDGKRKSFYRHSHAEAVLALRQANHAKMQGTLTTTKEQTVESYLQDWLLYRLQPRVRERTSHLYREAITKHVLPTLGSLKLQKLTPRHIERLYDLKRREDYAPRTIAHLHTILHQALEDAVHLHHLSHNVCSQVRPPRVPQGHPHVKALSLPQAHQLLAAAQGEVLEALYVLALTTGMRQGELLALTWQDIDFSHGKLQVRGTLHHVKGLGAVRTELKTVSSRRCLELTPLALDALRAHKRQQEQRKQADPAWNQEQWVFCSLQGTALHPTNLIRRSFRPLLEKAQVPVMRFHDLRHSTATLLLSIGVHPKIVQELLGHSQILVTLEIYSHVLPPLQKEAMHQFNAVLQQPHILQVVPARTRETEQSTLLQ